MAVELLGAAVPAMALGKLKPRLARQAQGRKRRLAQILMQHRRLAAGEDVARPLHREGCDRQPARRRFQQHDTEGVGQAREDEDVRGGIDRRELLALARAQEMRLREGALQVGAGRPVADHDLAAGQAQRQEGFEVLLDRDPADAEEDRPRQVEHALWPGMEQREIDAPPPAQDALEAMRPQLRLDGGGRDHDARRRPVEAAQEAIAPAFGDRPARRDILRETGVVARSEGALLGEADGARQPADRPLGRDMDMIGAELGDAPSDMPARRQRDADIGIGRQPDLPEAFRRQHMRGDAELRRRLHHPLQRAHHAVDLRAPGVRRDQDAHQRAFRSAVSG